MSRRREIIAGDSPEKVPVEWDAFVAWGRTIFESDYYTFKKNVKKLSSEELGGLWVIDMVIRKICPIADKSEKAQFLHNTILQKKLDIAEFATPVQRMFQEQLSTLARQGDVEIPQAMQSTIRKRVRKIVGKN